MSVLWLSGPLHSRPHLILNSALRELKVDTLAGQPLVDLAVSVQPVVYTTTLLLIQNNLEDFASVLSRASALTDDFDGVDEVGKDGVVYSCERTASRPLLCLRRAAAVAAAWAGQDAARGDN